MIYTNDLDKDNVQSVGNDPNLSSNLIDKQDADPEFHVTPEMLLHGVDNEGSLEEEESYNDVDHAAEIAELQKEGELPIEDLFAMYYGNTTDIDSQKENMPDSSETGERETTHSSRQHIKPGMKRNCEEMESQKIWSGDGMDDEEGMQMRLQGRLAAQDEINSSTDEYIVDRNGDDFDPFFNQRITRGLAALNSQYFEEEFSTDEEYQPTEDNWKKEVHIGDDYQAEVDDGLSHYKPFERNNDGDKLLWRPDIVTPLQLNRFLSIAYKMTDMSSQTPERDDEQVLYTLLQTRDVDKALRKRHEQERQRPDVSLWSEEECQNFEQGLRVFGKDFRLIQRNKVKSRSVGEIVQFYYLWKKTERHDAFVMQTKFGRKKYTLPGIADMMGRFMEENESVFSSRSTSPNFEQTGHDNQTTSAPNGNAYEKEAEDTSENQLDLNNGDYPIYNNDKQPYYGNTYNVNFNKDSANNTNAWRRTSPVSVVTTN